MSRQNTDSILKPNHRRRSTRWTCVATISTTKALLTSLSSCVSCAHLVNNIAELVGRISWLYQIQKAKRPMETILCGPELMNMSCTWVLDATDPRPEDIEAASPSEPDDTVCCLTADASPPARENDSCIQLEAKP